MGNREYGVLLKTREDLARLKEMIEEHNKQNDGVDTGSEEITWEALLMHKGLLYVCLHSGGGYADEWMIKYQRQHRFELAVFWPWDKPAWWHGAKAMSTP
jgi:hypothetical protein